MHTHFTRHAQTRAQQRGIPPLVHNWLMDYGQEQFDGHGATIRYFTRESIRRLEREQGCVAVKRMSEFLRCYLVQDSKNGAVITLGKRYPHHHIRRH